MTKTAAQLGVLVLSDQSVVGLLTDVKHFGMELAILLRQSGLHYWSNTVFRRVIFSVLWINTIMEIPLNQNELIIQ